MNKPINSIKALIVFMLFTQVILSSDDKDEKIDLESLRDPITGVFPIFSGVPHFFDEKYGIFNGKTPIEIVDDEEDSKPIVLHESQNSKQFRIAAEDKNSQNTAYLACKVGLDLHKALESSKSSDLSKNENLKKQLLEPLNKDKFLENFKIESAQSQPNSMQFNMGVEKILLEYYTSLQEKKYASEKEEASDQSQQSIVKTRIIPNIVKKLASKFVKAENNSYSLRIDKEALEEMLMDAFTLSFDLNESGIKSLIKSYFPKLESINKKIDVNQNKTENLSENIKIILAYLLKNKEKPQIKFVDDLLKFEDVELSKDLNDPKKNLTQVLVLKIKDRWATCVIYKKENNIEYFFADALSENLIENKEVSEFIKKINVKPKEQTSIAPDKTEKINLNAEPTIVITVKTPEKKMTREELPGAMPRDVTEYIEYVNNPSKFENLVKDKLPQNLILYGPPGTGKTTLARYISDQTNSFFISKTSSSFITMYQGEGEKNIEQVFKEAAEKLKECSRVVIFIDEIDRLTGIDIKDSNGTTQRLLGGFLKCLDERDPKIICILATNNFDKIPKELITRFERQVFVGLPSESDRFAILKYFIKDQNLKDNNDLILRIAEETEGLSRRELRKLVTKSSEIAGHKNKANLEVDDFYISTYLIQESNSKLPNFQRRLLLQNYFLQDPQVTTINNVSLRIQNNSDLRKFAEESSGLTASEINKIMKDAINLAFKNKTDNRTMNLSLEELMVALHQNNEKTLSSSDIRALIIQFYLNQLIVDAQRSTLKLNLDDKIFKNGKLDQKIIADLAELSEPLSTKRIKKFLSEAISLAYVKNKFDEYCLYVAVYKELESDLLKNEKNREKNLNKNLLSQVIVSPKDNIKQHLIRYNLRNVKHSLSDNQINDIAKSIRRHYDNESTLEKLQLITKLAIDNSLKENHVLDFEDIRKAGQNHSCYFYDPDASSSCLLQ